mmetsp:Transcript_66670/g.168106  ORF Transcript_66670/g.168106 Transcript_66670/m.168106 type:complete len:220 (-) Transcript_66670:1797-2456(-)
MPCPHHEAAIRAQISNPQHDLGCLDQTLLLLPCDTKCAAGRDQLVGPRPLLLNELALVEHSTSRGWRCLTADSCQEAPQVLDALAVHEKGNDLLVHLQSKWLLSAAWRLLDGRRKRSASLPIKLLQRHQRSVSRRCHDRQDVVCTFSQQFRQTPWLHERGHQKPPDLVLKCPESQCGVATAANQEEGPLRMQRDAIDVCIVLVAHMHAPLCCHIPHANR